MAIETSEGDCFTPHSRLVELLIQIYSCRIDQVKDYEYVFLICHYPYYRYYICFPPPLDARVILFPDVAEHFTWISIYNVTFSRDNAFWTMLIVAQKTKYFLQLNCFQRKNINYEFVIDIWRLYSFFLQIGHHM